MIQFLTNDYKEGFKGNHGFPLRKDHKETMGFLILKSM